MSARGRAGRGGAARRRRHGDPDPVARTLRVCRDPTPVGERFRRPGGRGGHAGSGAGARVHLPAGAALRVRGDPTRVGRSVSAGTGGGGHARWSMEPKNVAEDPIPSAARLRPALHGAARRARRRPNSGAGDATSHRRRAAPEPRAGVATPGSRTRPDRHHGPQRGGHPRQPSGRSSGNGVHGGQRQSFAWANRSQYLQPTPSTRSRNRGHGPSR